MVCNDNVINALLDVLNIVVIRYTISMLRSKFNRCGRRRKSVSTFVRCRFQTFDNYLWQFKSNVKPTRYGSVR